MMVFRTDEKPLPAGHRSRVGDTAVALHAFPIGGNSLEISLSAVDFQVSNFDGSRVADRVAEYRSTHLRTNTTSATPPLLASSDHEGKMNLNCRRGGLLASQKQTVISWSNGNGTRDNRSVGQHGDKPIQLFRWRKGQGENTERRQSLWRRNLRLDQAFEGDVYPW